MPCDGVEQIEAYAKALDLDRKHMASRRFVEADSRQGAKWRETAAQSEGNAAVIYLDKRVPLVAAFTFTGESGDWVLFATYYFRKDGSLAVKQERLNTISGNATVVRTRLFGCKGELLRRTSQHLDAQTKKRKAPSPDFIDQASPAFQRVRDLPFFASLGQQRGQ